MALEAVILSQDPFLGGYFKDLYSSFGSLNFDSNCGSNTQFVDGSSSSTSTTNLIQNYQVGHQNVSCCEWDQCPPSNNSSPATTNCGYGLSGGEIQGVAAASGEADVGRKKRRRRSMKNKEEVENQRMTHIAVERNRRKQMNEYLAAIRSLMPPSYVQRGDQASIIGGAINYVKELEQLLQSQEAQKSTSSKQQEAQDLEEHHYQQLLQEEPNDHLSSRAPFSDFFSFPQYSTSHGDHAPAHGGAAATPGAAEIEVNMADSHANVKIMSKRRPKQLLKLVAGFQALRLGVLHVNVTTVDGLALYSFSLKVEEGCHLNSVEEIAGAANHIIGSYS